MPRAAKPESSAHEKAELERDKELRDDAAIRAQVLDIYTDVKEGFDAQNDRYNDNLDFWDLYNCELNGKQFYNGNSQIFVPVVASAVNARKTRFVNQLFPSTQRHVQCVSEDATSPSALVSLLEYYVRKCKLRTQVAPALLRTGDVEGQYSVYISWTETRRNVTWKTKTPAPIVDEELDITEEDGISDPDEMIEDIEETEIANGRPTVEVIADSDLCVVPFTADSIEDALEEGGAATIARRMRKGKIKQMIREGHFDKAAGERLIANMQDGGGDDKDVSAKNVNAAGIKRDERGAYVLVYETWAKLELDGDKEPPVLCQIYMAGDGDDNVISVKRSPFWHDRVPVLSAPVEKVNGSFKGKSQVQKVATLQYQANDAVNEGMDSAAYALLPIIMTDPEKNPRVGSMILSLAAVWEVDPKSTQFAEFPQLWKDALGIVAACKAEIYEHLSVSPARITQQASTKKLTQAEIASEQQVDILNTADAVTTLEDEIFSPMLSMFIELDHQFRDTDITVQEFGEMGVQAKMQTIEPIQFDKRYNFQWLGVEAARNAQTIQQQIAAMNVLRSIPPQQYQGYKLNMAPIITQLVENVFGPRLAPQVFQDIRGQLSTDPELENKALMEGLDMPVHPLDNHQEHMQVHQKALQEGDPSGMIRSHLMQHQLAMVQQVQAQQNTVAPQEGAPGGPPAAPKPGAQPSQPRGGQNPAGAIHQDQMKDPARMPPPQGTPFA